MACRRQRGQSSDSPHDTVHRGGMEHGDESDTQFYPLPDDVWTLREPYEPDAQFWLKAPPKTLSRKPGYAQVDLEGTHNTASLWLDNQNRTAVRVLVAYDPMHGLTGTINPEERSASTAW
jgi:hypothetical protein